MIPASNDFLRAMTSSIKQLYLKLEFYDSKMNFLDEFTKKVTRGDIGSISVDRNRPIRRSFSFTLDNTNGEFNWGEENLVWIDKRVKVYTGFKLLNGEVEYIEQGLFIMSEPQDSHNFEGKKVTISGQDKAYLMTGNRGKLINELIIEEGANIGNTIKILAEHVGETLFNLDPIDAVVPYELTFQSGDNIHTAIEELALLARCEVYYDVYGYLRLKKIDLNEFEKYPSVWSYKYGDKSEKFYAGNVRTFDESNLANHIRVLGGSGQTAEVLYDLEVTESVELWKDNPYSIEKIGRITHFHNNGNPDGLITTEDEAKWRAKWELMQRLGYAERLELNIAPNFMHDASDIIEIEDRENSVFGKYLIESFQLPLSPQLMTCSCVKYRNIIEDWDFI